MLDSTTSILFSPFEREVANPIRRRIHTSREFENFISQNNGVHDCFTSVYSHDLTIDKLFFDFDGSYAIEEAKRVSEFVTGKLNSPIIAIVSGKKGIHLYILTKPVKIDDPRPLIRNAQLYILIETFGEEIQKILGKEISKSSKEEISKAFNEAIHAADRRIIGDVRRICRIPNTLRPPENRAWCTFLPPDWTNMSELDIQRHIKQTHTYKYDLGGQLLDIENLPKIEINFSSDDSAENGHVNIPGKENDFLKSVLRPCLYTNITTKNPQHAVRTATTIELLEFLKPQQVFDIYAKLDWVDWDPELTRYHIGECKALSHYSCDRLRVLGIPKVCCVG